MDKLTIMTRSRIKNLKDQLYWAYLGNDVFHAKMLEEQIKLAPKIMRGENPSQPMTELYIQKIHE